jgi:ABC-type multidrug transport system fused ATPase/permease subunit
MKTLSFTIISLLIVFLSFWVTITRNENKLIRRSNTSLKLTNDSLMSAMKNYTTYMLIDLEQSKIIDKFASSRAEKLRNNNIMELQFKLR